MTKVETTNSGSTKVVPTSTTVLPKTLNNQQDVRKIERQTDRQMDRQTERQTDR